MVTGWSRQGSKRSLPSFEVHKREDQCQERMLETCPAKTAISTYTFWHRKKIDCFTKPGTILRPVIQRFLQWEQLPALSNRGHPISEPSMMHSAHPSLWDLADSERDQSHSHPSQVSKPWLALCCFAVQVNRKSNTAPTKQRGTEKKEAVHSGGRGKTRCFKSSHPLCLFSKRMRDTQIKRKGYSLNL